MGGGRQHGRGGGVAPLSTQIFKIAGPVIVGVWILFFSLAFFFSFFFLSIFRPRTLRISADGARDAPPSFGENQREKFLRLGGKGGPRRRARLAWHWPHCKAEKMARLCNRVITRRERVRPQTFPGDAECVQFLRLLSSSLLHQEGRSRGPSPPREAQPWQQWAAAVREVGSRGSPLPRAVV